MTLDPFDWTGTSFLILYAVLFVAAIVASVMLAMTKRPEGGARVTDDPDALAYLSGGAVRFGEALVTRLLARGAIAMSTAKTFSIGAPQAGATAAERAVLALPSPAGWPQIAQVAKDYAEPLAAQLEKQGLLMSREEARTLRWWTALPFVGLLGVGTIKYAVGVARDKPVGILTVFMVVTAIALLIALLAGDRRTTGGIAAVRDARARRSRLKGAPAQDEMALAVALFGTGVLAASAFGDFHRLRQASSDGGGTDGGTSGDGGSSGGCGGGCGGCGGS